MKLNAGTKSISESRENPADLLEQTATSRLLSDVLTAIHQIEAAQGVSHRDAKAELRKRLAGELDVP